MPNADRARSHLKICCHGLVVASSTSSEEMPRARASTRAWSWWETISWSRNLADRSFISTRHTTKTTSEVTPEMMNWLFHPVMGAPARKWSRVLAATMLVMRLPATGPTVQKPMAEARPTWGLKSRTMAGVATRMAPSTRPRAEMTMAKPHSPETSGTPTPTNRPTMSRP